MRRHGTVVCRIWSRAAVRNGVSAAADIGGRCGSTCFDGLYKHEKLDGGVLYESGSGEKPPAFRRYSPQDIRYQEKKLHGLNDMASVPVIVN